MAVSSNEAANAETSASVGYFGVLRQNPNFRNMWFSQLISAAGDWFNNVAVLGLTLQLTGSGLAAGLVLTANSLPLFLLSPVAGPIVDRFDRRKVMIVANLFGAVFALTLLLVRDASMVWLVYPALALIVSTASFANPAAQALVPNIVTKQQLFSANALSGSTWGIMVMVGSALGGVVSAAFGRDVVFIFNSVSFLLAAWLIWTVKAPPRPVVASGVKRKSTWREFGEGLGYLRQNLPIMAMVAVKGGWSIAAGVISLFTIFSQQIFKAGDDGIGLLFAGRGLGALLGPMVVRSFVQNNPRRMRLAIIAGYVLSGVGYILFGFSEKLTIFAAFVALILAHTGGGLTWTLSSILLQQRVPDRLRGRIFSVDLGIATLVNSISTLIWGGCLQAGASPVVLAWIGGFVFICYSFIWATVTARPPYAITDAD